MRRPSLPMDADRQAWSVSAGISRHWSAFSLFVSEMKIVGRHYWSALFPGLGRHRASYKVPNPTHPQKFNLPLGSIIIR